MIIRSQGSLDTLKSNTGNWSTTSLTNARAATLISGAFRVLWGTRRQLVGLAACMGPPTAENALSSIDERFDRQSVEVLP